MYNIKNFKDVENKLLRNNYVLIKFIGRGEFGYAYDIGNDRVLKITSDEREANSSSIIIGKNFKNIVKIFRVFKLNSINDVWFIEQEKLKSINKDIIDDWLFKFRNNNDFALPLWKLLEHITDDFISLSIVNKNNAKQLLKNLYCDNNIAPNEAKFLKNMIDAANDLKEMKIIFKDWHSSNIMQKNGYYKIIDLSMSISSGVVTDILEQLKLKTILEQKTYTFKDGKFKFYTAEYGSWANDKRIVFRVRADRNPRERAIEKNIKQFDRIIPSTNHEIEQYLKYKKFNILKIE